MGLLPSLSMAGLYRRGSGCGTRYIFSACRAVVGYVSSMGSRGNGLFAYNRFSLIVYSRTRHSVCGGCESVFRCFSTPLINLATAPGSSVSGGACRIFRLRGNIPACNCRLTRTIASKFLISFVSIRAGLGFVRRNVMCSSLSSTSGRTCRRAFTHSNRCPRDVNSSTLGR